MTAILRGLQTFLIISGAALSVLGANADDWPAYRKDGARSAVTETGLAFPLGTAWARRMPQAPEPAWPDCGRAFPIFEFDYAFMPVAAGGIVYLGSSADDTVYALRAGDGSVLWTYTAAAPVRFAPHIAHGRCYFSSDDGFVYCLDAQTGEEVWTFRLGLDDRMFLGNGRLVSRRPSRSGVLIDGETLYTVGGMWPSEGVAVYALDARTGEVRWRNDTINAFYLPYPHDGLSLGGPTSQGYLLTDGETLAMPTGEGSPAMFDARTGEFLHWDARPAGSTWAALVDGFAVTPARGWQPNLPTRLGEAELFRADGMAFFSLKGGRADYGKWGGYDRLPGSAREGVERWRGQIAPIGGRNRVVFTGDRFFASGMGELEALDSSGSELKRLWKVEHERIYSLILAGDALIAGCDGFVAAVDARSGRTLWRGEVDGQARGLAVAGGVLYVSTDRGTLYAFGQADDSVAGAQQAEPARLFGPLAERDETKERGDSVEGYALVVGAGDTAAAERLAAERKLHVVALLADGEAVREARARLVRQGVYGRHIVVHQAPADGALPYADYFADEVLVAGRTSAIHPSEVYRVLRPISGRMTFAGMTDAEIAEFVRRAGVPEGEFDGRTVARGRLEGAFDWNSEAAVDGRVSWPLELLWFGGPGRQRVLSRHRSDLPPPVPAAGRVYQLGDGYVVAVDAYNGKELWSCYAPGYRHVAADDDHAYISMGGHVMQLDAQTGKLLRIYGNVEPPVFSLDRRQAFRVATDDGAYGGSLAVGRTDAAVEVRLTSKTPAADDKDGWVLWFDFRLAPERLLPSGPGAFPLIVDLKRGRLRRFEGFDAARIPAVELRPTGVKEQNHDDGHGALVFTLQRANDAEAGSNTLKRELRQRTHLSTAEAHDGYLLRIPLAEIRRLTGHEPESFDMAAEIELYLHADQRRMFHAAPITQRRDPWRRGTATFVLRGEAQPAHAPMATVDRGAMAELPAHARQWGRMPQYERHDGNIPRLPVIPEGREDLAVRTNPITGQQGDLFFLRGYGCSGTVASATMNLVRSGTVGLYDLEDDSGMRNLPGTRSGCRITLSPALGLLVSLEGTGDCFCPYNFPTNVAMAPARRRSNEDWAVFIDQARVGQMRQLALNFGAPGDRRDERGLLWLGYPRAPMMYATGHSFGPFPQTIGLPMSLDVAAGGKPYRVNADRVIVENTNLPWVAASGLEGVRKLELSLVYHEPLTTALASPAAPPPRIDGRLDDDAWSGDPGAPLASNPGGLADEGRVRVRFDRENLYLGFARRARTDRRGAPLPWPADTQFNVFLKDAEHSAYAQFRVGLDGARSSRAVSSVVALPQLPPPAVDANPADWTDRGVELALGDGHGTLQMAWTDRGPALFLRVPSDRPDGFGPALRAQFANLERERIVELIVDTAEGTARVVRGRMVGRDGREVEPTVFDELATARPRRDLNRLRESEEIDAEVAVRRAAGHLLVEAVLPLAPLELDADARPSLGFQLSAFDPEHRDGNIAQGAGARRDLLAGGSLLTLVSGDAGAPAGRVAAAGVRNEWYGKVWNFQAAGRELPIDRWTGAVGAEEGAFQVEMAVPLGVLAAADLSLDRLLAQFGAEGDLSTNLDDLHRRFSARFVRIHTEAAPAEAASYIVRLHFAELGDVAPGERVFDVHIQGRPVLERFDIVHEAGGPRRAVTRDFRVTAGRELNIEFLPLAGEPCLSGLEVIRASR